MTRGKIWLEKEIIEFKDRDKHKTYCLLVSILQWLPTCTIVITSIKSIVPVSKLWILQRRVTSKLPQERRKDWYSKILHIIQQVWYVVYIIFVTIMMQYIILYHNAVTASKHHVIPASQASETNNGWITDLFLS